MDYRSDSPIYLQIATHIKEEIMNGALSYGDKLPSVREYSLLFEVSALTMQRELAQLDEEGIIQAKCGTGNFVLSECRENLEARMVDQQVQDFVAKMRNVGLTSENILEKVKEALANG